MYVCFYPPSPYPDAPAPSRWFYYKQLASLGADYALA